MEVALGRFENQLSSLFRTFLFFEICALLIAESSIRATGDLITGAMFGAATSSSALVEWAFKQGLVTIGAWVVRGGSTGTGSVSWMGPAWKTKPKFVVMDRALWETVSDWAAVVIGDRCTQLLSGASSGAHDDPPERRSLNKEISAPHKMVLLLNVCWRCARHVCLLSTKTRS